MYSCMQWCYTCPCRRVWWMLWNDSNLHLLTIFWVCNGLELETALLDALPAFIKGLYWFLWRFGKLYSTIHQTQITLKLVWADKNNGNDIKVYPVKPKDGYTLAIVFRLSKATTAQTVHGAQRRFGLQIATTEIWLWTPYPPILWLDAPWYVRREDVAYFMCEGV